MDRPTYKKGKGMLSHLWLLFNTFYLACVNSALCYRQSNHPPHFTMLVQQKRALIIIAQHQPRSEIIYAALWSFCTYETQKVDGFVDLFSRLDYVRYFTQG